MNIILLADKINFSRQGKIAFYFAKLNIFQILVSLIFFSLKTVFFLLKFSIMISKFLMK